MPSSDRESKCSPRKEGGCSGYTLWSRTQISLPVILRGLATCMAANSKAQVHCGKHNCPQCPSLASLLLGEAAVIEWTTRWLSIRSYCVRSSNRAEWKHPWQLTKIQKQAIWARANHSMHHMSICKGQGSESRKQTLPDRLSTAGTLAICSGWVLPFLPPSIPEREPFSSDSSLLFLR